MLHRLLYHLNKAFQRINNSFSGRSRSFIIISRAIMATLLGLTLSFFLIDALTLSTTAMFSAPEKRDFKMSDLFAQIADNRPVKALEDRIIIVNIGRGDRYDIANGLSLLSLCGPKAIGIDINFEDRGDDDSILLDALKVNENVVLPLGVSPSKEEGKFIITDKPFFYDELKNVDYGIINFPLDQSQGTIRDYAISFQTEKGDIPSFVTALAEKYDPSILEDIKNKNAETGVTSYHSKEFQIVELPEIEEHAEDFVDKIVMIGALDDSADMHATPIRSHMAGVMLHAAALSTILDGVWYNKIPKTFDYVIAVSLCFIIMLIVYGFRNNLKGITIRLLQGMIAFLAVRIGYYLFVDRNIVFDISFTIMIVTFGLLAADIWNGLETLWNIGAKKINSLNLKYNS